MRIPAPLERTGRQLLSKLFILCIGVTSLRAQEKDIDRRMADELRMNFPAVYFRHNSTDYAPMPYTVDSCFKYIARHLEDINSFTIWRDSGETELLSGKRIKKLKAGLSEYTPVRNISIVSMGQKQKISGNTIRQVNKGPQQDYLFSLNSVFEISKARFRVKKTWKICWHCLLRARKCQRNTFLFSKLR